MSTTEAHPATKTHVTEAAKAKAGTDTRIVAHVSQALEAAQADLASIGGSLGSGARDLGNARRARPAADERSPTADEASQ